VINPQGYLAHVIANVAVEPERPGSRGEVVEEESVALAHIGTGRGFGAVLGLGRQPHPVGRALDVFEDYDHARARGADILAEVVGFAMTSDASDIVMPSKQGAARAITGALRDGRIDAEDVGYINAHGTGTAANDKTECAAVADALGSQADRVMISSTKAMHGHCIGGTGAVELLACIMALRDGVIAPTIGYEEPDPECALDVVPNTAREADVSVVLSNAFAFGGLNAVLALRKA